MLYGMRDLGLDRQGIDDPIGCICSTRTVVNWAFYTMTFGKKSPMRTALDFAMQGSINPESKDEVEAIIQRLIEDEDTGLTLDTTVEDAIQVLSGKK